MKRPAAKAPAAKPPVAKAGPVHYMHGTIYVNASQKQYRVKKQSGDRRDVNISWSGDAAGAWARALAIIEDAASRA